MLAAYQKLQEEHGSDIFNEKYVFTMYAEDVQQADTSQQRASGHSYHIVNDLRCDIEKNEQQSPISISIKGGKVKVEDGNTRLLAILRIQEETGVKQEIVCSNYYHSKGLDENLWKIVRFKENNHPICQTNGPADFEKTVSELYNGGYFDKELRMTHDSSPHKYRAGMITLCKQELVPRWTESKIEKVVDKVINFQGFTPNFWSYDTPAAIAAIKLTDLGWNGTKTGKSDNGMSVWVVNSTQQVEKDQVSYAYRRRKDKPTDKRVLVLYAANLSGKGENYIKSERIKLLKLVNKWNEDDGRYLWDEVYFMPQIKRCENRDTLIKMKITLDKQENI